MGTNKKVVKYKKPFNINIGIVIFIIIFIYLIYNVFSYMTTTHIVRYEVGQGTMAENNIYQGLILRSEKVSPSAYSGTLNYYVKEASKVSFNNLICSIDENGDVSKKINEANRDISSLDADNLEDLEEMISSFQISYRAQDFYHVYTFKEDLDSSLNEALNLRALNEVSDYAAGAMSNNTFHQITAERDGVVVYYTDGMESVTTDNFTPEMLDPASYERVSTKKNTSIKAGDPLYKLITSEIWNIVIPITPQLTNELADDDTIQIRFLKDDKKTYATYKLTQKDGQSYLILTLKSAMIRYAGDRYAEIELLRSEKTGLKIPNSSITEKEFFTISKSYFVQGGNSKENGLLVEQVDKKGKKTTEFVTPTIYYTKDDLYYIDSEDVSAGDRIVKPDSSETYVAGSDTAALKGVYNINKGFAVFKQIDILYQSEEYTIIKTGTAYGVSLYDHIALDSTKVKENELLQ